MKANMKFIIYLLGVAILGLIYYPLKGALPAWLFVAVAIGYLLILRLLAEYIHKRVVGKRKAVGD